jgi:hypothetical protein
VGRINRLWFTEYRQAGWFKVVTLRELHSSIDESEAGGLDQYGRVPDDPSLDCEVIRLFLSEWLMCQLPESVGVFGLDPAEFRPVGRAEALTVASQIVAASLDDSRARVRERVGSAVGAESADVPYSQLQAWFTELFAEGCRFYLHDSTGGPTVRFDMANPRVIGLAPDLIGLLWME